LTLGPHGALTPDRARRKAAKLLAEAHDGGDPAVTIRSVAKSITVADLAKRFVVQHAEFKKKPASVRNDRLNLRLHVLPRLGPIPLAAVSRADIASLHHALRQTPTAANRVLALLSKMFNLAERWGLRVDGTNPCRHVERFPERPRERFLSDGELARLGSVLMKAERDGVASAEAVAAIRLLLLTGCRVSEVLQLRWEDVDIERRCLKFADSKTGAKRIPLNSAAISVLDGVGRRSAWVLPGRDPSESLVNLAKPWDRIRDARNSATCGCMISVTHTEATRRVRGSRCTWSVRSSVTASRLRPRAMRIWLRTRFAMRPNGWATASLPRCKGRTLDSHPLFGAPIIDRERMRGPASLRAKEALGRTALWLSAGALFCVSLISMDRLRDDSLGDRLEMGAQGSIQLLELWPEDFFRERPRDPRHHRSAPLAGVPIRLDAIPPKQGNEEGFRPAVRKREAVLDRTLRLLELLKASSDAISRTLRCRPLAGIRGACNPRLDLAKLLDEPLFLFVVHPSSTSLLSSWRTT
jgi:integrase